VPILGEWIGSRFSCCRASASLAEIQCLRDGRRRARPTTANAAKVGFSGSANCPRNTEKHEKGRGSNTCAGLQARGASTAGFYLATNMDRACPITLYLFSLFRGQLFCLPSILNFAKILRVSLIPEKTARGSRRRNQTARRCACPTTQLQPGDRLALFLFLFCTTKA
jgi:hypothetical protein